jgi:hypothetical protein
VFFLKCFFILKGKFFIKSFDKVLFFVNLFIKKNTEDFLKPLSNLAKNVCVNELYYSSKFFGNHIII